MSDIQENGRKDGRKYVVGTDVAPEGDIGVMVVGVVNDDGSITIEEVVTVEVQSAPKAILTD